MKRKFDLIDMDYLRKLSPEEREWMKKFIGQYYFNYKPESKSDTDRNNAIRRDLWIRGQRTKLTEKNANRFVRPKPLDVKKKGDDSGSKQGPGSPTE